MKIPGPDHPITIATNPNRVRVRFGERTIVDTRGAMTLREASYPPVLYVPREDAVMTLLTRTDRVTRCPHKGDATYFTIKADERTAENAVWSYEHPYPAVSAIATRRSELKSRLGAAATALIAARGQPI